MCRCRNLFIVKETPVPRATNGSANIALPSVAFAGVTIQFTITVKGVSYLIADPKLFCPPELSFQVLNIQNINL